MYSPEVDVGFGASIATPYSLAGHASTFEVGGCFRNEHKFVNQNTQNFTPTASGENASPAMTNFLNDFQDPNYYGGAYQFGPTVEYDKVRTFAAVDAGIRWAAQSITATTRVVPRIGFVWNPAKNGRTSVSGGIGVFYDSVPLNVYAFSHYPEQIITNYLPDGTVSGNPQTYLNLTAEAVASGIPFVDQDHNIGNFAPYTVAWSLQAQHQFSERLTMRAKYLENHGSGLVTISPQVVQGQNAYVLAGDGRSRYRQFELTTQVSFQRDNKFYASYVQSLSEGTLNESDTYLGDLSSRFIRANLYTNRTGDIPNRFLTWGSVALPWKIKVYPKIELRSGFPHQSVDVYQNYIQNMKTGSLRFPTYVAADARVAKDVKLNSKYTLRPSISITNITNHFNALQIHNNTADPQSGQFFGSYDRHERFDLDLVF